MATRESIARRRDIATRRIADALAELHARVPDAPALDLHPVNRDLDERNATLLEAIAAGVEFMLARIADAEQPGQDEQDEQDPQHAGGPADSPAGENVERARPRLQKRGR